jgi:hypothetical protein
MLFNTFQRLSTPLVHLVPPLVNLELLISNGLVRRLKRIKSGVKIILMSAIGLDYGDFHKVLDIC